VEAASSFVQHAGSVADPKRQKGPHGHMIETDKANRFALAADLGLDQSWSIGSTPRAGP
jgi:6-phosphogluconolactonase